MSDINSIAADLAVYFPGANEFPPEVVTELASIMRMHGLTVEDIFYKWESNCIKMKRESADVTLDTVRTFKQAVQDEIEKKVWTQTGIAGTTARRSIGVGGARGNGDVLGMLDGMISTPAKMRKSIGPGRVGLGTPATTRIKMETQDSPMMGHTPSKFTDRKNAGEIIEFFAEDNVPENDYPLAPFPESRTKLSASSDQRKVAYKPLAMKLSEASEILDDRIDEFMMAIADHHSLDLSVFGSPASQSTTDIVAVGRICNDSAEGKLNAASVVLETSRRMGNGLRVPLNTSKLTSGFSFFPGQIIAARGTNISGNEFVANQILALPVLPSSASLNEALQVHRQRLKGDPEAMDDDSDPLPLNFMMAAGPYTADDNLEYEPLREFCRIAGEKMVDVLVLAGPFIDIDHPLIASGDFDLPEDANYDPDTATMSTVFKYMISTVLTRLTVINPAVTIILIPSTRDAINKHVSWPQDSFSRKDLGLPRNARTLTNPMSFSINEVLFGVSSQDIIFELCREELVGGRAPSADIMTRVSRHILEQKHFFPLFPPADRSMLMKVGAGDGRPQGALLDTSYLKLGEMIHARPDVLVLPSSMPPFVKVVESVLVVNPGHLSKRAGPGTYARMCMFPLQLDENVPVQSHDVYARSRIEIVRI